MIAMFAAMAQPLGHQPTLCSQPRVAERRVPLGDAAGYRSYFFFFLSHGGRVFLAPLPFFFLMFLRNAAGSFLATSASVVSAVARVVDFDASVRCYPTQLKTNRAAKDDEAGRISGQVGQVVHGRAQPFHFLPRTM